MLPGVELARRRRVHYHEAPSPSPRDPSALRRPRPPIPPPASMDEPAVLARRRLEEKLRRSSLMPPSPSSSSASSSSSSSSLPRWMRHVVGEGERSRQGVASKEANVREGVLERRDSRMDLCAVCLDELQGQQRVMWLPCSHKYHSDCLLPWLAGHSQCPCCRTVVPSLNVPS